MTPFRPGPRVPLVLWLLTGLMVLVEGLFWLADEGAIDVPELRGIGYAVLGFFDTAFEEAMGGRAVHAQLLWSFVTHSFVHGGWMHVIMNAVAFLAFGNVVCAQIGTPRFLVFYAVTAAAGALALGLITEFGGPLVGSSGVVFGLLGILTAWEAMLRSRLGHGQGPVISRIVALVALNVVLWYFAATMVGGSLAWEAHLGGFVAGWALAHAFRPRALRYSARPSVQG